MINKCNQCKFTSSHVGHLGAHLKTHRGEMPNKCNQCNYTSAYASHSKTHLKTQCDYASFQTDDLRRHLKTHSGGTLKEKTFFSGIAQITSPTIFITFRGPDHVPVRYMCGNIFDATAKLKKHYVSILEKGPKRHNSLTTHTCKNRKAFRQCGGPCPSPPRLCPSLVRSKSCESKN